MIPILTISISYKFTRGKGGSFFGEIISTDGKLFPSLGPLCVHPQGEFVKKFLLSAVL